MNITSPALRTVAGLLLGGIMLSGCNTPKPLYQWESYQPQVYSYLKGDAKEEQAIALSAT